MPRRRSYETERPFLPGTVVQDFYHSFWFSQGDPGLQYTLFKHISTLYGYEKCQQILANSDELQQKMKSQRFPHDHIYVTSNGSSTYAAEFSKMTSHFISVIRDPGSYENKPLSLLSTQIMDRDVTFQDPQKCRGYNTSDPHQSHFRDYALLQHSTGSATYDELFTQMRHNLTNRWLEDHVTDKLHELANAWEAVHPDEDFIPRN